MSYILYVKYSIDTDVHQEYDAMQELMACQRRIMRAAVGPKHTRILYMMHRLSIIVMVVLCLDACRSKPALPAAESRNSKPEASPKSATLFAPEEKLLFDYRASRDNPAPTLSDEARRNLLSAVFPHYLDNETECEVYYEQKDLEAARNSGQIVPELLARAAGSFTRSGARQMAYLIKVGECMAQTRSYFGTYRLAIFENDRLIAADRSPYGDFLDAVIDVDGDNIEEILISGCGSGTGVVTCSASLLSIAGGTLRTIRDFSRVYWDGCLSIFPEPGITATVIMYAPGRPPQFFEHPYEAACPAEGQTPEFRPATAHKF
jgi:hypothetical protein